MKAKASSLLLPLPLPSPPQISSLIHKLSTYKPPSKPTSLYSTLSTKTSLKPQTPLFLKPPIHTTTPTNLNTFTTWAKTLISSIQPTSTTNNDNDLDPTLLHRELKWFLDDVVENPTQSKVVNMRECLDTMYKLWEDRIVNRRPFQYIVGCEHWRDLVMCVQDGVLIPRPETSDIVDLVEGFGANTGSGSAGVWADLGTGSGALAIGIARVLGGDNVRVVAVDISPIAVGIAKFNVERYGLQDIIDVRQGSWFDPVMEYEGQLAGIVSNPPYIPSEDMGGLQAEVGKHEPWLALDGGVRGLDFLSYLCTKTSTMLKPGGFFAFETNGQEQCKILADYLTNVSGGSICNVNVVSDFAGVPRFVTGQRR